ncbi:hypothetical protein SB14R_16650 [Pseudomonas oryzihabitans]|nr:hypothetical protein SB14R_16650 [Pseudomonas psychrotolerans]
MQPTLYPGPVKPEQGNGYQQPDEQQGRAPGLTAVVVGNGIEFGDERASVVLRGLAVTVFGGHAASWPGRDERSFRPHPCDGFHVRRQAVERQGWQSAAIEPVLAVKSDDFARDRVGTQDWQGFDLRRERW